MNKRITLGSLFDGIGGFPLSGTMCGIEPVWASEIEPFPIAVTMNRLPNMKHIGSVTDVLKSGRLPRVGSRSPKKIQFSEHERKLALTTHERAVRCIETGIVYRSIREAANCTKCTSSAIGKQIRGKIKRVKGCHWEYADTEVVN